MNQCTVSHERNREPSLPDRHDLPRDRIITPKEAAYILGVSRSTLFVLAEQDEQFPSRVQITERRHGWKETDLMSYIESKKCKRGMS